MVVAARRQASLWLAPAVRRTLPLHDNIWSPVSVFRVLNKAEAPASSILQAPGTRLSSVSSVVEEMGELLLQLPVAGHRQTRALDARDVQLLGLFALQRLDQGSHGLVSQQLAEQVEYSFVGALAPGIVLGLPRVAPPADETAERPVSFCSYLQTAFGV